jgi:hypothetical protein
VEVILEKRVNLFHFFMVKGSEYIWIRFANYLSKLLVSYIFLMIARFGMENALLYILQRFLFIPIKPNPPREGDGKWRVFSEDGRAAEGLILGLFGFLFLNQKRFLKKGGQRQ